MNKGLGTGIQRVDWYGLYRDKWTNIVVDGAMSHPAKFAKQLIARIYDFSRDELGLKEGSIIIDPFGGVALGALNAMSEGHHWIGVEVEEKFFLLGQGGECHGRPVIDDSIPFDEVVVKPAPCGMEENHGSHHVQGNIEAWNEKHIGVVNRWGSARLILGDSRYLVKVLRDNGIISADGMITSPPFLQTSGGTNVTSTDGALSDPALIKRHAAGNAAQKAYGQEQGQLGAMGESSNGYDMALTSPPFTGVSSDGGFQMLGKYAEEGRLTVDQVKGDPGKSYPSWDKDRDTSYGQSDGQLADMPANGYDLALSSPPYADIAQSGGDKGLKERGIGLTGGERHFDEYGDNEGQLGRMKATREGLDMAVGSPPYSADGLGHRGKPSDIDREKKLEGRIAGAQYGDTDGQLGNMDGSEFDGAISSPPYAGARIGKESGQEQCGHTDQYGDESGQLGGMDVSGVGFGVAITSPPFEDVTSNQPSKNIIESGLRMGASSMGDVKYGYEEDNIGHKSGNDFWIASRMILDNLYQVLKPGAYAIFVCKRYVKAGQYEFFPRKWAKLTCASGFAMTHWIRAWVVEDKGLQKDMFTGEYVLLKTERKSFFRRLAERKGAPPIDWEDVLVFRKPLGEHNEQ